MKKLLLYLSSNNNDIYLGDIFVDTIHGEEVFSFSFSDEYLSNNKEILIDPELNNYKGRQYSSKGVFGFIKDMIPDRFGKLLIDKQEKELSIREKRDIKKLNDSDYLERVNDLSRMGALRIKSERNGVFLNDNKDSIPPYIYLRDVEYASLELEKNDKIDSQLFARLLLPSSSLGGARPKANVYINNEVYIAKFPSRNDSYDVELLEYITLDIAKLCELNVPEIKLDKFSSFGHTLLIKRFDRNETGRIHYISGVTALMASDGDSGDYSYYDLTEFITSNCSDVKKNKLELYKRLMFNYLINNTDNHLRNHAFIINNNVVGLSPLFDVNPSIFKTEFALPLTVGYLSKESIINESIYYSVDIDTAEKMYNSMAEIVMAKLKESIIKFPSIKNEIEIILNIVKQRI